jgi:hypothetical protein
MQEVKIRLVNPALSPRRTKLEMPGWAGQPEPRADGAQEYAWHCAAFTEGAQYGMFSIPMTTNCASANSRVSSSSMATSGRVHKRSAT